MSFFAQRRAALPVLGWLAAAATPLCAQQLVQQGTTGTIPQPSAAAAPAQAGTAGGELLQQTAFNKPTTFVTTRLNLVETISTRREPGATSESEAITRVAPGLYASSRAGRVQGFLDYSLLGVAYANASGSNRLLNQLRSNGTAEIVERHAYLDAQATITQQAVNPLGVDSEEDQTSSINRSEVRTVQLTPRVQGRLGDMAQWEARLSHRSTHSAAVVTSDSSATQWQLQAGTPSQQGTTLLWATQFSHNVQDFSQRRSTVNDVARGVLDWRVTPDFSSGVIAGYEATDIASDDKQGRATYGLHVRWVPSERTSLFAETEKRFFGNSHNFTFSHRMARSVVSFSDVRTLSYGLGQPLVVGRGSMYEFFDQLYSAAEPDAGAREAKVLQVLRTNGLSATESSTLLPSFLSSTVTQQRLQQISYAWSGVRDTVSFSVQQTSGQRVENREVLGDPFTLNTNIRQRGFLLLLVHKLTPLSSLTLTVRQRRTLGDTDSNKLSTLAAQFTTSLGPHTSFSLSARHSNFKSSTQPYTESALTSSLSMTF